MQKTRFLGCINIQSECIIMHPMLGFPQKRNFVKNVDKYKQNILKIDELYVTLATPKLLSPGSA